MIYQKKNEFRDNKNICIDNRDVTIADQERKI
jgi:hypothetical protein